MWPTIKVVLSTAAVLGLIRLTAYLLVKYAPKGMGIGNKGRIKLLETLSLPGGNALYLIRFGEKDILIGASKQGLQLIESSIRENEAENIDV